MFLPESMSRIVIVGANSCIDETTQVLYDIENIHLIDQTVDADEGFTLGTPRPYSPKTAERLLKVRGMEKDLGINKHTKTVPISESEIRSQITSDSVESIEKEVRAVLDKRNDLNQRVTELNAKKKSLELLVDTCQMTGDDQAVATVVAGAAEEHNPLWLYGLKNRDYLLGTTRSRTFHQLNGAGQRQRQTIIWAARGGQHRRRRKPRKNQCLK